VVGECRRDRVVNPVPCYDQTMANRPGISVPPRSGKDDAAMPDSVSQVVPFAMVPRWVLEAVGFDLTVHDLAVYTYLSDRAGGASRDAFPGMRTIADKLGIAKSTVQKSVKRLEGFGCVVVSKVVRGDGNESNHYHLPGSRVYRQEVHPEGGVYRSTVQGVPSDGTGGVPLNGTEQEPPFIKNQEQEPLLAPAAPERLPAWVQPDTPTPSGTGWVAGETPHVWTHPEHGRRDLLWEAVEQSMPLANERERGRRSKAVALLREAGVSPDEFEVLRRVYLIRSDGKWPDTDVAIAGRVSDLRRWVVDPTTFNPKGVRHSVGRETQRQAAERALAAGPDREAR